MTTQSFFRFRYRLRAFLIFISVLAVLLSFPTIAARQQKKAVVSVEEFGLVHYDFEVSDGLHFAPTSLQDEFPISSAPSWLIDLCGIDFLHTVVSVECHPTSNEDLAALLSLSRLRGLTVDCDQMSFEQLVSLRKLRFLEELSLFGTKLTEHQKESLSAAIKGSVPNCNVNVW
jgi:hypothetical protein